jgi:hypothetical protein
VKAVKAVLGERTADGKCLSERKPWSDGLSYRTAARKRHC